MLPGKPYAAFRQAGAALLPSDPRIDGGVQQIGNQVGEDNTDHDDSPIASSTKSPVALPRSQCLRDSRACLRPCHRECGDERSNTHLTFIVTVDGGI
jgi:hypothetical protein